MIDAESTLAKGMLRIAIQRMAKEHPFHANMLSPDSLVCDPGVKTMGVTICNGRIQYPYAPEFVLRCSYDELIGVFQHEINHLLFGHVVAAPEEYPDSEARIIAEEVTVNEWVVAPLPGRPLTLDQFPALKPLEDTKTRYVHLARKTADRGRNIGLPGRKTVPTEPKLGSPGPKTTSSGQESGPPTPKSGPPGAESAGVSPGIGGFAPLDNHDIWGGACENPVLGKLVIAAAVHEAREALDDSQWQALPDELRQRVEELTAGHSPGTDIENLLDTGIDGSIDWRKQLRRYVAQTAVPHPTFHRPPRRMPELIGIFPGQCRLAVKPVIMAIIDTSDSMILALLEIIKAELKRLARDFQVMVVECDTVIQASYPYRGSLKMVHGRGGTDLRPPFEAQFLAKIRPDVVIYFTDGDGPAPDRPPSMPVIWCLTPLGSRPVAWGREIQMSGQ
jgi:predicted metal-dependent peptidase